MSNLNYGSVGNLKAKILGHPWFSELRFFVECVES